MGKKNPKLRTKILQLGMSHDYSFFFLIATGWGINSAATWSNLYNQKPASGSEAYSSDWDQYDPVGVGLDLDLSGGNHCITQSLSQGSGQVVLRDVACSELKKTVCELDCLNLGNSPFCLFH